MAKLVFDDEASRLIEDFNASPGAKRRRARIIELLALSPGDHVLDVGSGPGDQVHEMASIVGPQGRIVGIDSAESAVTIARGRCVEFDTVTFQVGEADSLPFGEGEFDAVMSSQVFEYLDEVHGALVEMFRVLKPGGCVLIHDTDWGALLWNSRDHDRMRRIMEAWDGHLADPHLPRTLRAKCLDAGFTNVRPEPIVQVELNYKSNSISAILMKFIAGYVVSRGVAEREIDAWMEDLLSLDATNEYFFSSNEYVFLAEKPHAGGAGARGGSGMEGPIDAEVVHRYEHETWTRCAATYLDHFAGLTRETMPLLREAAKIQFGSTVLDIGSGPGHVAGAIAEAGAVVTGIDFSARMVEVARQHYPQATFLEANAERLPFDDASFQAVVSNFVVHHLARPDVVFREVCRVLEPGGSFAFVVFERPEAQSSIGAFFEAVAAHHDSDELPHAPLFGAERSAYEAPLNESGLSDLRFETHDILWRSDTVDPVLQAFLEWGNIAALPKDVQQKIELTARENLEAYRDGGGYAFPHAVLLGTASKPGSR